jgi:3-oxoacyl-[acyl-carrier protein] reductase
MKINLDGKVALVCASTRGLGYACALGILKAGGEVIITGRTLSGLEHAKSQLIASVADDVQSACVHSMVVDLDERLSFDRFLEDLRNYPDVDILVTNSGGPAPGDFNSFSSIDEFEKKCSEITYAASSLIKHVLPKMKEKRWGRIINISSIGLAKPITGLAVSNASRAHLAGLMTGIANENASFGVTLNTILPGIIWTDRQKALTQNDAEINNISFEEMVERKASSIPSGKMGEPNDVGSLVTFLSSDYAGYINSQNIAVDGGFLGLLR